MSGGTKLLALGLALVAAAVVLLAAYRFFQPAWPLRVVNCHSGEGGTLIELSNGDCELIARQLEHLLIAPTDRITAFEPHAVPIGLGLPAPPSITLQSLPQAVTAQIPKLEGHQFFMHEDDVMIVAPGTRRIVTQIDIDRSFF